MLMYNPLAAPWGKFVHDELRLVCQIVSYDMLENQSDPPETLLEAMALCQQEWRTNKRWSNFGGTFESRFRNLRSGMDRWGNGFRYHIDKDTKKITLRSFGPNHRDDLGSGDDLMFQCTFDDG